jgi:hypothetical protein
VREDGRRCSSSVAGGRHIAGSGVSEAVVEVLLEVERCPGKVAARGRDALALLCQRDERAHVTERDVRRRCWLERSSAWKPAE